MEPLLQVIGYESPQLIPGTDSWNIPEHSIAQSDHIHFTLKYITKQILMYHSSKERSMQRSHTRAFMPTFNNVYPEYTLEDVSLHYTLKAVGPPRACTRIHSNVHNLEPV